MHDDASNLASLTPLTREKETMNLRAKAIKMTLQLLRSRLSTFGSLLWEEIWEKSSCQYDQERRIKETYSGEY